MPIVRSVGDIPSQVEHMDGNSTFPLEIGADGDSENPRNPVGRPRTRQ